MITIKERATITEHQHLITIDVGQNVPKGEYEVEVILKEVKDYKNPLSFRVSNANIDPTLTFSREELYDDDGR